MSIFSFGKKLKQDDISEISIDISMLLRWYETNDRRILTPDEARAIINRMLARDGFKYKEAEVDAILYLAFTSDIDSMDGLRERTDFDKKIVSFFNSIGMTPPTSARNNAASVGGRLHEYSDFVDQPLFDLHALNLVRDIIVTGKDLVDDDKFDRVVNAINKKYPYDEDFSGLLYDTVNTVYCLLEMNGKNSQEFVGFVIGILLKDIDPHPSIVDYVNEHRRKTSPSNRGCELISLVSHVVDVSNGGL